MNVKSTPILESSFKVWPFLRAFLACALISSVYTGVLNLEVATIYPEFFHRKGLPYVPLFKSASQTALVWTAIYSIMVITPMSLCIATAAVTGSGPVVKSREVAKAVLGLMLFLSIASKFAESVGRSMGRSPLADRFEMVKSIPTPQERSAFLAAEFQGQTNMIAGILGFFVVLLYVLHLRRVRQS